MICPEGYFTPKTLEAQFERVLSNDRVFPQVFASSGASAARLPPKDRTEILRVCSVLFVQRFVHTHSIDLLVYSPSRTAPLKIDSWLLKAGTETLNALPETAHQAQAALTQTDKLFPLLSIKEWSVNYDTGDQTNIGLSKTEKDILGVIGGWSLCFSDNILPADLGQSINIMATRMGQEARAFGAKKRGPGRTRKVDGLIERLRTCYPKGIPDKSAKQITRDLCENLPVDFSPTTLRKAIDLINREEKSVS
ncbi:MAG: hypothetical protein ACJAVM_003465 [Sulfitobacter sp.]